ncbi:MAG: lysine 2,3-aminomutase, partial [Rhodospirillales bacterium]
VILSGGDPLILTPQRIKDILNRLEKIDHVGTIRIHTRVPALDPDRITSAMLKALNVQKPLWIVLHCNHASEIDQSAEEAIRKLIDSGIPMLSQTVLLKGINDNSTDLTKLMRTLVENRIKPYYLHQGDLAQGTSHFRTTLRHGRNLVRSIRGRLSGIAQPLYVLDIPGGFGKVSAEDTWITPNVDGMGWIVEDHKGATHHYEDNIEPLDSE